MKRRWPVAAVAVAASAAAVALSRDRLARAIANVRAFSAPTAGLYDALASPVLDGFFTRVADDVLAGRESARVLEIGSGPGRLASRVAELGRDASVVASDVAPAMLARAASWADRSGVGERVRFVLADVTALPFADASFDAVVTTLSLHHWPDARVGLAEVRRVLRPGGIARVYDIADWVTRFEPGGNRIRGETLFTDGWTKRTEAHVGPVPLLYRADLSV